MVGAASNWGGPEGGLEQSGGRKAPDPEKARRTVPPRSLLEFHVVLETQADFKLCVGFSPNRVTVPKGIIVSILRLL